MRFEFVCENDNIRLSDELKLHISRRLYRSIRSKNTVFFVNKIETLPYKEINKGDIITFEFDKNRDVDWDLYDSKLDIYYEDDNYLIVYKRDNLLSIPTKGNPYSLYQEAIYYLKNKNESTDISILNRLDKDTKGLVLIAKNPYSASLMSPVHEHMERRYVALCSGIFKEKEGTISAKIKKVENQNKRIIAGDGQIAITHYRVLDTIGDNTLVEFLLETGRTHQIRIHSAYIGHPIIGDTMYGDENSIDKLHLLSYYIKFENPYDKRIIEIKLNEIKF